MLLSPLAFTAIYDRNWQCNSKTDSKKAEPKALIIYMKVSIFIYIELFMIKTSARAQLQALVSALLIVSALFI